MPCAPMDAEELQLYQLTQPCVEVWLKLECDDCFTICWHKVADPPPTRQTWVLRCTRCDADRLHEEKLRRPVRFPA